MNGHAAISPEMALRIEKALGVNMDMLHNARPRTPWPDAKCLNEQFNVHLFVFGRPRLCP